MGLLKADHRKAELIGRIGALVRTNDLLSDGRYSTVEVDQIIRQELEPFGDVVSFDGCNGRVLIDARTAQSLSMMLHELATTAAKYGPLAREGRLEVKCVATPSENGFHVAIIWSEFCMTNSNMMRKAGFGTTLLEGMAQSLRHGQLSANYSPTGMRCIIEFDAIATPPPQHPSGHLGDSERG